MSRQIAVVLSISRRFSHRGRTVRHRPGTKKAWHVYFVDTDGRIGCKRISSFEVPIYKTRIKKTQTVMCPRCGFKARTVKGEKIQCPICSE